MTEVLPLNNSHLPLKLRLEDYLRLDEAGAFEEYRKTELIEGEIFFMNAQHRPHAVIKSRLHVRIAAALAALGHGWEAVVEGSIAIPPHNSPEPDIVVTSEPDGKGLIPLDSVKLIIEVSDATLTFDTKRKLAMYARNGVPEYWVVDVNARVIHQMWAPVDDAYAESRDIAFGERLTAATIPTLSVDTSAL
ncbi:Uma2 family endonuclease [Sphingomonas psychrotolerans]|uniref:Uma2 family endonuclease n=1 Tax=Sphingomonas psychrotolerans TaxID=1327635 RepID=A0A2K8MBH8_9SPHN|nr:Uma2 family endonuclease [Sphingomonas psychrotolerans]ATY31213.1 Uma2 family endonuclease [Sphingomonas psychrotolerans]